MSTAVSSGRPVAGLKPLPGCRKRFGPAGWLALVALMLAYYIVAGRWLKGVAAGTKTLPSSRALRWFNELPVLLMVGIIWLVLAKPF